MKMMPFTEYPIKWKRMTESAENFSICLCNWNSGVRSRAYVGSGRGPHFQNPISPEYLNEKISKIPIPPNTYNLENPL